jgi:prophage regulatory protein
MTEQLATAAPLCLLRLPQVIERVGLRRTAIYDGIKHGTFPPGIRLGRRCRAWPSNLIDSWVRERIAQADATRAGQ